VYFDIGQEYAWKEIKALPDDVIIHKVDWLKDNSELISKDGSASGNIIIPGRNSTLVNLAASIYCPDEIWLGALLGEMHEGSTDKNNTFKCKMNNVLKYIYSPFERTPQIVFPLADMNFDKLESVRWLLQNGVSIADILKTSSCLKGTKIPCGTCVVCCRRKGIFLQLGFSEEYQTDPFLAEENIPMIREMLSFEARITTSCHYDNHRRREIVPALIKEFNLGPKDLYSLYVD
jgi:7-cyano-7-deazaguanine synthase in queuosine biosynthesis